MHYKLLVLFACIALGLPSINAGRRKPKIIGGRDSNPEDFKYHVAVLELDPETSKTNYLCGGAIIHRRHILTSAYCVYNRNSSEIIIRAGGDAAPPVGAPFKEHRVYRYAARIMYFKDYVPDKKYHEYDIAVVKIVGTFDLADDRYLKKVYLPTIEDNDYIGKLATVSGYGVNNLTKSETEIQSGNFRSLQTEVISSDICQNSRTYLLTSSSLCTQDFHHSGHTCYGDGGDPLVYDNQIIGVLNSPTTCDSNLPELFTKVSIYAKDIQQILNGRISSNIEYR